MASLTVSKVTETGASREVSESKSFLGNGPSQVA